MTDIFSANALRNIIASNKFDFVKISIDIWTLRSEQAASCTSKDSNLFQRFWKFFISDPILIMVVT